MDDDKPRLPPKKDVALALLQGTSLYVHLDPRREQVLVPKHFLDQPQLVLQVGLNMAVNIPDLEVDEEGITCTLSFNRTPFWCRLPWSAVFALVGEDGRGMVWPDDVPGELAAQARRPSLKVVSSKKKKGEEDGGEGKGRKRPTLSAVPPPIDDDAEAPSEEPEPEAPAEAPNPESPARGPSLAPAPAAAEAPSGASDEADAEDDPDDDPDDDGGKKKLPPYLRVVK